MLRSFLERIRRSGAGGRTDALEARAIELRRAAVDYAELVKQPGWQRLVRQIEADVAAGIETYLMPPPAPSKTNPLGSIELHERQRAEWLAEARGMRSVIEVPHRMVAEAGRRGLMDGDEGKEA
jgi:hypothetical protein